MPLDCRHRGLLLADTRRGQALRIIPERISGNDELRCACQGRGGRAQVPNKDKDWTGLALAPRSKQSLSDMLSRLSQTVAFSTRRGMATHRKTREPYSLKKKRPWTPRSPLPVGTQLQKYGPVDLDNTTSFGLRPPEKEPWKPDDDRFDTSKARELDRPIGGAPRQRLVVRPAGTDRHSALARPQTSATPESHSRGESKSALSGSAPAENTITPSRFLIVRRTMATIQDMLRALREWEPLEICESEHIRLS